VSPLAHLEASSDTPLYKQLSDQIRIYIQTGQLSAGDKLPATRDLASQLGVNRATVSAAYQLLESDGLINAQVGRGSFVLPSQTPKPRPSLILRNELPSPTGHTNAGISFASSRPSQDLFPLSEFRDVCGEVLDSPDLPSILQLGSPFGYEPLRQWLISQSGSHNDVVITNGCQQALDLLARVLVKPGDTVVVEDPVYPGLREPFARAGARLLGVPIGADGCSLDALEPLLARERPRLVLVTPSFQNPTGASLPLESRRRLILMARASGATLIENDIYSALRYEGDALPSLKRLDDAGAVIQLGSFSKVSFPGLRVGWVLAPPQIAASLAEAKQWSDLHSDHLSQAVLLRFAQSGRLQRHLRRMVAAGAERLAACLEACATFLPDGSHFTRPRGGMNLWVRLPAAVDTARLLRRAEDSGVSYLPGPFFSLSGGEHSSLRLSFAVLEPDKIREGVSILANLFQQELERAGGAPDTQPAFAMV